MACKMCYLSLCTTGIIHDHDSSSLYTSISFGIHQLQEVNKLVFTWRKRWKKLQLFIAAARKDQSRLQLLVDPSSTKEELYRPKYGDATIARNHCLLYPLLWFWIDRRTSERILLNSQADKYDDEGAQSILMLLSRTVRRIVKACLSNNRISCSEALMHDTVIWIYYNWCELLYIWWW